MIKNSFTVSNIPKIDFIWNSEVIDLKGEPDKNGLETVVLKDIQKKETYEVDCDGLFLGIGHTPNSQMFPNELLLDERGYILTEKKSTKTSIPGVFAAGDIMDPHYKQAITAAGSGCMAALDAEQYIENDI